MVKKIDKNAQRLKRHTRVRGKISGTPERPRLNVFRSNANIYAQVIDDVNGVTTQEIVEELAYYGIDAERKGIYRDMNALREFGYKIEQRGGKEWYLATRPMDLQEMIMLVDAVQSSPFLTEELTDRLIGRIQQLASIDQRKLLQKRIEVPGRVKMDNEGVL